jgi:2'-5' RNA ligase
MRTSVRWPWQEKADPELADLNPAPKPVPPAFTQKSLPYLKEDDPFIKDLRWAYHPTTGLSVWPAKSGFHMNWAAAHGFPGVEGDSLYAGGMLSDGALSEYHANDPQLSQEGIAAMQDWANKYGRPVSKAQSRHSNIFDPISPALDQRVFDGQKPKRMVAQFISRKFYEAMDEFLIDNSQQYFDLLITGSLTTYQYSDTSDCDISVFPHYDDLQMDLDENDPQDVRRELVRVVTHHLDGTILPGSQHPLQFFVIPPDQTINDYIRPGMRSGWSFNTQGWIVPPEKDRVHDISSEMPELYHRAQMMADKMKTLLDSGDIPGAQEMFAQIHKKRNMDENSGLGDFSEGNIMYKFLLHEGLFKRLREEAGVHIASATEGAEKGLQRRIEASTQRLFLAFELPDSVVQQVMAWQQQNMPPGVYPEPATNLHMTIAFLGEMEDSMLPELQKAISEIDPSQVTLSGPIEYRELDKLAFLALQDGGGNEIVEQLNKRLYDLMGYQPQFKPWLPHITVWRFAPDHKPNINPALPNFGSFNPLGVHVYTSIKNPSGQGGIYKKVANSDMQVIYNFEHDNIILGNADIKDKTPRGSIIVGTYDGKNVKLFNTAKQWINANYFKRLWAHSFPTRPIHKVFMEGNEINTRPLDQMTYTQKLPWLVGGAPLPVVWHTGSGNPDNATLYKWIVIVTNHPVLYIWPAEGNEPHHIDIVQEAAGGDKKETVNIWNNHWLSAGEIRVGEKRVPPEQRPLFTQSFSAAATELGYTPEEIMRTALKALQMHRPEIDDGTYQIHHVASDPWRDGKDWKDYIKNNGIIVEFQMGDKKDEKFDGKVTHVATDYIEVHVGEGETRKLRDELLKTIKFRVRDDEKHLSAVEEDSKAKTCAICDYKLVDEDYDFVRLASGWFTCPRCDKTYAFIDG